MEWLLGINKWWASCCCFLYWFALRLRYATVLFRLVNATTCWYYYHYSGERTVLLLTIHFLPDMQAAKSTLTIQIFHVFHYRSANSEPQPHTSADKCLRTPRKVVAKSSLHSISLTLAWLPVRHFNLISFPKLNAVLIVKGSRSCERCVHMCRHTHAHAYKDILLLMLRQGQRRSEAPGTRASHPHKGQHTEELARHLHQTGRL